MITYCYFLHKEGDIKFNLRYFRCIEKVYKVGDMEELSFRYKDLVLK